MNERKVRRYFKAPATCPIVTDWASVAVMLEPGDIGCSVGSPQAGGAFRLAYGVPFTHTYMVGNPTTRIGEALPQGFVEGDMDRYSESRFAIFRWKGINSSQQFRLGTLCLQKAMAKSEGKAIPYDWGELSWLIFRGIANIAGTFLLPFMPKAAFTAKIIHAAMGRKNLLDRKGRQICSGEVEDISETEGFTLGIKDGFVAPGHYATTGRLDWVLVHVPAS